MRENDCGWHVGVWAPAQYLIEKVTLVTTVSSTHTSEPDLELVLKRIQNGQTTAILDLYNRFSTGIRFLLKRALNPDDIDDQVRDVLMIVLRAIRVGDICEPAQLTHYVYATVKQQIAKFDCDARSHLHRTEIDVVGPSNAFLGAQGQAIAMQVLESLPKLHREVLSRFYLHEESPEDICRSLKLTETAFSLIMSRARARLTELEKCRIAVPRRPEPSIPTKVAPSSAIRETTTQNIRSA
jgi:DNA-directed RNA polymerase specialized sigma24 family protein